MCKKMSSSSPMLHCSRSFCEPMRATLKQKRKLRETDTWYGGFNDFLTNFNQVQLKLDKSSGRYQIIDLIKL